MTIEGIGRAAIALPMPEKGTVIFDYVQLYSGLNEVHTMIIAALLSYIDTVCMQSQGP